MLSLIISPIQANDMLMDQMPAANPAPDFNLMGMDGKTHTLEDLKGKFVLVNFWATWCNPCKVEMPLLEKLHQTLEGDKFTVLGITCWTWTREYRRVPKTYAYIIPNLC